MSELGCLRDGHFNNLQVDGKILASAFSANLHDVIHSKIIDAFSGKGDLTGTNITTGTRLDNSEETTPDTGDTNINFFHWLSGLSLYSYNIGSQSSATIIPQKENHGYNIAGKTGPGLGREYITSLQGVDSYESLISSNSLIPGNLPLTSFAVSSVGAEGGIIATFIVEFTDISGVSPAYFGIRKTTGQGFSSGHTYQDYGAFKITTSGAQGNVVWESDARSPFVVPGPQPRVTNLTSPKGGLISDGEVWEFKVQLTGTGNFVGSSISCHDTHGEPNQIDDNYVDSQIVRPRVGGDGGSEIFSYAPYIHFTHTTGSSIILHSLKVTNTSSTSLGGGH